VGAYVPETADDWDSLLFVLWGKISVLLRRIRPENLNITVKFQKSVPFVFKTSYYAIKETFELKARNSALLKGVSNSADSTYIVIKIFVPVCFIVFVCISKQVFLIGLIRS
jgi:hypothetical protein